ATAVLDQTAVGTGPVGVIEGCQCCDYATAGLHFEHRTVAPRTTPICDAEEIAAGVLEKATIGVGPVGVIKGCQRGDDSAAGLHLEHRAIAAGAAGIRGTKEIAVAVLDHPTVGVGPMRKWVEGGEGHQVPCGCRWATGLLLASPL